MKTLLRCLFVVLIASIVGFLFSGCSEKITGPTDQRSIGKIAFSSDRDDGNGEICVMNADYSNKVNLTNNVAADISPSWSPDGRKIAFTSVGGSHDADDEIYIMNTDGSDVANITNNPAQDWYPNWTR